MPSACLPPCLLFLPTARPPPPLPALFVCSPCSHFICLNCSLYLLSLFTFFLLLCYPCLCFYVPYLLLLYLLSLFALPTLPDRLLSRFICLNCFLYHLSLFIFCFLPLCYLSLRFPLLTCFFSIPASLLPLPSRQPASFIICSTCLYTLLPPMLLYTLLFLLLLSTACLLSPPTYLPTCLVYGPSHGLQREG